MSGNPTIDYVHACGTSVRLDFSAEGAGPLPKTVAQAWFSLLFQLVTEKYSFAARGVSICLDFMTVSSQNDFLHTADMLLAQLVSVPIISLDDFAGAVHRFDSDASLIPLAVNGPWALARAVERRDAPKFFNGVDLPSTSCDAPPVGTELRNIVTHNVSADRHRRRFVLVYACRTGATKNACTYDAEHVPTVAKLQLVNGILEHLHANNLRFDSFAFEHVLVTKDLFKEYCRVYGVRMRKIAEARQSDDLPPRTVVQSATGVSVTVFRPVRKPLHALTCADVQEEISARDNVPLELALGAFRRQVQRTFVTLSDEQRLFLYFAIEQRKNLFLTGNAGAGKSFIVKVCMRELGLLGREFAATTPTGRSAINIGGSTIYSWSGVGLCEGSVKEILALIYRKGRGNNNDNPYIRKWLTTETLFIDEVSMLNPEVWMKLDLIGRQIRQVPDQLFGGMQIIAIGDFFQLEPVFARGVKPKFNYVFQTENWIHGIHVNLELTRIFRQRNPMLVSLLNNVRRGEATPDQIALLANRQLNRLPDGDKQSSLFKNAVKIYPRRAEVARINGEELDKISSSAHEFTWKVVFNEQKNISHNKKGAISRSLDKEMVVPSSLILKIGARVVCKSNISKTIVNGSTGTVTAFACEADAERLGLSTSHKYQYNYGRRPTQDELDESLPVVLWDGFSKGMIMKRMRIKRQSAKDKALEDSDMSPSNQLQTLAGGGGSDALDAMTERAHEAYLKGKNASETNWDAYVEYVPLQHGWAVTVHGCQGMSIRSILLGGRRMFARGQFYVGVSRIAPEDEDYQQGNPLSGVFIDGFAPAKIMASPLVKQYYDSMGDMKRQLFGPLDAQVGQKRTSPPPTDTTGSGGQIKRQNIHVGAFDFTKSTVSSNISSSTTVTPAATRSSPSPSDNGTSNGTNENFLQQMCNELRDSKEFRLTFANLFRLYR